ncbi:hypothetical protein BBK36DRAFT_1173989 [Trichoderma citrinoviride]|uniref:Transcription elongation factor Eaf N-terminal domain-containing protein n=1 Tax=Trichoderma citrinoviride TaxID=58853 RepID=A0A2T4BM06_9HYPO|nr:hypothetical protein BBK36DRAFT_1173989 [Trichoderma citrinoviride]PTB70354.1 hypothetical protein BBK36DRAFT_1173989 [Trichoderma citrinoviride]
MAELIDPTAKGNYPIILGDGLLGKTSNDIFTGIRYNHKPSFPASDARLKPSLPGKTTSYDLTFPSPEGTVGFAGTRSTDDDDYVLWFDPERKAFILDKVDSTFNMNLTRIPGNSNPEELRRRYPHLENGQSQKVGDKKNVSNKDKSKSTPKADDKTITKPVDKQPLDKKPLEKKSVEKRSLEKKIFEKKQLDKKLPKKIDLALPMPQPPKPAQSESRKKKDDDDDEEDEDDDGDLLIEYPGAENPAKQTHFSPAFPAPRRFDDFMDQRESEVEEEDDDQEDEDDGMDPDTEFKLPSPLDLEQELENAFEKLESNGQDSGNNGYYYNDNANDDESEISEED